MSSFTSDVELACRFDRFTSDVNAIFKKRRNEIPALKKKKLPDEKLFADVFIFYYIDSDGKIIYIKT